ncbi:hypothetical protein B0A48_16882 [Cryoendolithus antarcticus]|uniref:F-box domain-containing protein n=1 Tax=Cryoendolithus antarcticus TaxID=1507870 RepID=A0A1V8SD25_9PEZI|nr:hypothetical protein B0A48_16882 [Cryoendolithus antarcticus]
MAAADQPPRRSGILDLPSELHEQIWTYVDWDSAKLLLPDRPDIFAISLTCSTLRKAVLPLLFRHVVLRLRWAQGALYEPTLLKLRRNHPDLAQYVRTVQIRAEYGQVDLPINWSFAEYDKVAHTREKWSKYEKRCVRISESPALVLGETVEQWLDPAKVGNVLPHHVSRVHDLVHALIEPLDKKHKDVAWLSAAQAGRRRKNLDSQRARMEEALEKATGAAERTRLAKERNDPFGGVVVSPDDDQGQDGHPPPFNDHRMVQDTPRAKLKLEALALAVSCISGSVSNIIINACPVPAQRHYGSQHSFILATAAAAVTMLGPSLTSLSVATPEVFGHTRVYTPPKLKDYPDSVHFPKEVIEQLKGLQTFRLIGHANSVMSETKFTCWLPSLSGLMSNGTLRSVELWDTKFIDDHLYDWLSSIRPGPGRLVLHDVIIQKDRRPGMRIPADDSEPINRHNAYLAFALGLRTALPSAILILSNVTGAAWDNTIPVAGERFVSVEVCNVTGEFSNERQYRLLQDFKSFVPQWRSEEQREENTDADAKQFGKLIDAAMASRSFRQWS